jgi:hypothetical protein
MGETCGRAFRRGRRPALSAPQDHARLLGSVCLFRGGGFQPP